MMVYNIGKLLSGIAYGRQSLFCRPSGFERIAGLYDPEQV